VRRAVFIDKDGTLVEDVPYNVDPARVRLARDAVPAVRRLAEQGFTLVIVTNQAGVARGLFPESAVEEMGRHLIRVLADRGVRIAGFYFCPHLPDAAIPEYRVDCDCRKPQPGLIRRACDELDLNPDESWMVGDIATDVAAGQAAGCRTVLANANPARELEKLRVAPTIVAATLNEAADALLSATEFEPAVPVQPS
jgi:D-glycero-D-manno-heptose 1,7-bisphosphate phosphatase